MMQFALLFVAGKHVASDVSIKQQQIAMALL
jgi:hypothetical protein